MRAWYHETRGTPAEVLKFTTDFTPPSPSDLGPEDVLVKVAYCGTTPGISMMMPLEPSWLHKMPAVPEIEFSGTVAALGPKVKSSRPDLEIGVQVFGVSSMKIRGKTGFGTLSEFCPCPMQRLACVPNNMSLEEAAALPGNGITALQALDLSLVKKGGKILINGGSGGTGSMMVQYAKAVVGETGVVVSTCSALNMEMVKRLGADEVIDYRKHEFLHDHLAQQHSQNRFDAIIDTVGLQELYTHCPEYLRDSGRFINIGAMGVTSTIGSLLSFFWLQLCNAYWPAFLGGTPRWFWVMSGTPDFDTLTRVKKMVEDGGLKVVIDSVWDMKDALKAYEVLSSKRARGKVLIKIEE